MDVGIAIVGIDPGKTTGFAAGRVIDGHFVLEKAEQYRLTELDELVRQIIKHLWQKDVLRSGEGWDGYWVGTLVIEDFKLYAGRNHTGGGASDGLSPVFVTGFIMGSLHSRRPQKWKELVIVKQMAANAKRIVTDARLKAAGLWVPGKQHARDAIRHAELYARKVGS